MNQLHQPVLHPGDRITWALGGLYYNGEPRVVKHGEVAAVFDWGYSCYADDVPREVNDASGGFTRFTFSVPFSDILGGVNEGGQGDKV